MDVRRILSALFGVLFLLMAASTVWLCVGYRDAAPVLLGDLTHANACTDALMEAVCDRDFATVRQLTTGETIPNIQKAPGNALSQFLWEEYGACFSYQFQGDCYITDYGVYRDVQVTVLDIPTLMEDLQLYAGVPLAENAANTPDAYAADGTYTRSFVMEILTQEAKTMLETDFYTVTRDLTLRLSGTGNTWLVCPERALTDVITGGMGGF